MANIIQAFPAGSDSSNETISKSDFDNLTPAEQDNGTAYFVPDADIVTNFTVMGNRFDKANIYTADERMIGSYLGKPLYQKTIDFGALPNNTAKSVTLSNYAEIDKVISIEGFGISDSVCIMLPRPYPSASPMYDIDLTYEISSGKITALTTANYAQYNAYVTIQYTKTSDATVNIGTQNDYSTDEQIIGTWIDGKRLYQKTVSLTINQSDQWTQTAHNINNVDTVVKIDGVVYRPDGWATSMGATSKNNTIENSVQFDMNTQYVEVYTKGTPFINASVNITIQYTKTTD